MTGLPENEITGTDVGDAVCEVANMTAGGAKLRLSGGDYAFTLSSPCVITGKEMSIGVKNKAPFASVTLGDGEISVRLKLIY